MHRRLFQLQRGSDDLELSKISDHRFRKNRLYYKQAKAETLKKRSRYEKLLLASFLEANYLGHEHLIPKRCKKMHPQSLTTEDLIPSKAKF